MFFFKHGEAIRISWKSVIEKIAHFAPNHCFGFFVLEKILNKSPDLKLIFGISEYEKIEDIPSTHKFNRHVHIFNSMIDLAVNCYL